jgi:shikimate dehydrogenase
MKRACVIGWPIEHSRSPLIHGHWLRRYAIAGSYEKVAVRPEDLASFIRGLAAAGYEGCNATVPHKEHVLKLADHAEPAALAVGAANTVWVADGKVSVTNTDTYGYMSHLSRTAPHWDAREAPVSVLGAGGAARAIVYGFLEAGVPEVRVFNRTRARAEELAAHFGARVQARDWAERTAASRDAAVIVNTTTMGMKGEGDPGIDFAQLDKDCVASDIVYVPLETAFLESARAHGLATVDGLGMLLHQAVPGFEKWFGVRPEVDDELYRLVAADIRLERC